MQESSLVSKGNQKWYQTIKNKTIAENIDLKSHMLSFSRVIKEIHQMTHLTHDI